ncbi:MAG TPA: COX15/CtaA family protein, partial [Anaerolineae bacterium]
MSLPQRRPWLPVFAWCVTGFNMLVIAWGALVRATGSGAGCGSHWPQCNGSLLPDLARIETAIEFGHRVSSVLAGLLVIILVLWVMRSNLNRLTRLSSWSSLAFIILEGILGALLVRLELVADNTSTLRAGVVALHLVNTLMLLASLGLTAFASGRVKPVSLTRRPTRVVTWLLGIGLVAMALLSAMGAVTALGDTLFPATSLSTGF